MQHGTHKGGFIFAVAVPVREDVGRSMRLPSADADFDGDVADIALHELRNRAHFLDRSVAGSGKGRDFLLSLGDALSLRPLIRVRYQLPICCQLLKPLVAAPPGGKKVTIIWPMTPAMGGMSSSLRTAFTSLTTH